MKHLDLLDFKKRNPTHHLTVRPHMCAPIYTCVFIHHYMTKQEKGLPLKGREGNCSLVPEEIHVLKC